MTTIEREQFKSDPVYNMLYKVILSNYRPASHTQKVLYENRQIENFCEESRHFAALGRKSALYIHFDVSSWFESETGFLTRIDRIAIYDNFKEYESARSKGLHSTVHSDGVNLN